jgi:sulfoxide reductase heme-binding subunit YedZ
MPSSKRVWIAAKTAIWVAALMPAAWLAWDGARGGLGANPIEAIMLRTGWWGLVLLTVTLAITPLRRLTGWHSIVRVRRLLGLFAFFYICLHLTNYVVVDQWFDFQMILEDITERPFITVGFTAWLMLLSLAITSTRGWIRRLGRKWQRLHRLVYVAASLGALHFFWKVKADTREPLVFVAILAVLLLLRVPVLRRLRLPMRWGRRATSPGRPEARRSTA